MGLRGFLGVSRPKNVKIINGRVSLARTNRDPEFYGNVDTYKEHGTGLASGSVSTSSHYGVAANRGEIYEQGLGGKGTGKGAGKGAGGGINNPAGHRRVDL